MPFLKAFLARPITYGSGSPKPEAGPVSGLTKPILIEPLGVEVVEVRQASRNPGTASPPRTRPVPFSISRRVIEWDRSFLLLKGPLLLTDQELQIRNCSVYRR